jgi:hypothetical protein
MKYSRSKKFAWTLLAITSILTALAIVYELEGVAVGVWASGIPSAAALYSNKQYQDRKKLEIEKGN